VSARSNTWWSCSTAAARIDFEVRRDPARANGKIAQACRTSIPAVRKSRERLGLYESEEAR